MSLVEATRWVGVDINYKGPSGALCGDRGVVRLCKGLSHTHYHTHQKIKINFVHFIVRELHLEGKTGKYMWHPRGHAGCHLGVCW